MHDITEHDSVQEWERDDGRHSWIEFLVVRCTIRVYNQLEYLHEVVRLKRSWSSDVHSFDVQLLEDKTREVVLLADHCKFVQQVAGSWAPSKSLNDQRRRVCLLEHVESGVDGLFSFNE